MSAVTRSLPLAVGLLLVMMLLSWYLLWFASLHARSTISQTTPDIDFSHQAPPRTQALAASMGIPIDQFIAHSDCRARKLTARVETFDGTPPLVRLSYCDRLATLAPATFDAILAHELGHLQHPIRIKPYLSVAAIIATLSLFGIMGLIARRWRLFYVARTAWVLVLVTLVAHITTLSVYREQRFQSEFLADAIAAEHTSVSAATQALRSVESLDLGPRRNCRDYALKRALFCYMTLEFLPSHPDYADRIARLSR